MFGSRDARSFGGFFFLKLFLGDLAYWRPRHIGADIQIRDHLMLSDLILQKILQLVESDDGRLIPEFYKGLRRLAAIPIVNSDNGHFSPYDDSILAADILPAMNFL